MSQNGVLSILFSLTLLIWSSLNAEELSFNTQEFAPFSYTIDGNVSGSGVEIVQAVCNEAQLDCPIQILPWSRAQAWVKMGKNDGIFYVGKNEKRERWLTFTPPILVTEYGFFAQTDSGLKFESIKDLQGKHVAVYGPSNTANSLEKLRRQLIDQKLTPFEIEERVNDEWGFLKLSVGRVDMVYSNIDVGRAIMGKLKVLNVHYIGTAKTLNYHIGFSKRNTDQELVKRFMKSFDKLMNSGKIQRILQRHNMIPAIPFEEKDKGQKN